MVAASAGFLLAKEESVVVTVSVFVFSFLLEAVSVLPVEFELEQLSRTRVANDRKKLFINVELQHKIAPFNNTEKIFFNVSLLRFNDAGLHLPDGNIPTPGKCCKKVNAVRKYVCQMASADG